MCENREHAKPSVTTVLQAHNNCNQRTTDVSSTNLSAFCKVQSR